MNWLAHLRLSPADSLVRIGNLAGDFVRGFDIGQLHPDMQRGIEQHRAVDRFVDAHPVFRRSRERLRPDFRRFAGVVLDVFYDHYLARDWHLHGDGGALRDFVDQVHDELHQHRDLLPPQLAAIAPRLTQQRWLGHYDTVDGVDQVLRAMAHRARRATPLATSAWELVRCYDDLGEDFVALWSELAAAPPPWS